MFYLSVLDYGRNQEILLAVILFEPVGWSRFSPKPAFVAACWSHRCRAAH